VVSLVAAGLAVAAALTVPFLTFWLALRQDHIRWLRERRADVYIDTLAEAYAEKKWLEYDMADDATREPYAPHFVDLRLPPLERARLGARGNVFGSPEVNVLANRLGAVGGLGWRMDRPGSQEGQRVLARVEAGKLFAELEAAIRAEIGTDDPRLTQH